MENLNVTQHIIQTAEIKNWCMSMANFTKDMLDVDIKKDKKKSYKDRRGIVNKREYASLDNIIKSTRGILIKNGLFVVQALTGEYLSTKIIHSSGEYFIFLTPFFPMSGSGTSDLQNIGGGITYLKRYAYTAALNISLDDDNDGEFQGTKKSSPQVLPNMPKENIEDAAKIYLSDQNLARIEKKYFIPDSMKFDVLKLAAKLEKEQIELV